MFTSKKLIKSVGSLEYSSVSERVPKPFRFRMPIMDVPIFLTLLVVTGFGFIVLYSAVDGEPSLLIRQGVRILLAFCAY